MSQSLVSSRSSSYASNGSAYRDLSQNARTILNTLCNERDFSQLDDLIAPDVVVQHEDNAPVSSRQAFVDRWAQTLQRMPDFKMDIKEACVDEGQNKVWVRSEVTGIPGGVRKESIDMMTFDDNGLLVNSIDSQRILRSRDDDEEDEDKDEDEDAEPGDAE